MPADAEVTVGHVIWPTNPGTKGVHGPVAFGACSSTKSMALVGHERPAPRSMVSFGRGSIPGALKVRLMSNEATVKTPPKTPHGSGRRIVPRILMWRT